MKFEYFHIHIILIQLIQVNITINFGAYVEKDIFELLVSKMNSVIFNDSYPNF